jgi:hypothetical protein
MFASVPYQYGLTIEDGMQPGSRTLWPMWWMRVFEVDVIA